MNPAEEQSVQNAENPMEELIAILLSKGDKEFNTFCDMLERSNHRTWVDSLRKKTSGTGQRVRQTVSNMTYSVSVESDGVCNRVVECSILMSWPLHQGPLLNITTPLTEYLFY